MQKSARLGHSGEYQVGSIDPMLPSEALRAGSEDQTNRITCRQLPFHDVGVASNTLRWIVRAGAVWQLLSGNFPLGHAVCDQTRGIGADHLFCLKKCVGRATAFLESCHSVWMRRVCG
jgi:hypothetical protein